MPMRQSLSSAPECLSTCPFDAIGPASAGDSAPRAQAGAVGPHQGPGLDCAPMQLPISSAARASLGAGPARRFHRDPRRSGTKLESSLESVVWLSRVSRLTRIQWQGHVVGWRWLSGKGGNGAGLNPWRRELRSGWPAPEDRKREGATKLGCHLESAAYYDSRNGARAGSGWQDGSLPGAWSQRRRPAGPWNPDDR